MKRNKLTRQVKTLSATAAVLLAYGLSVPAGIAAQTGGVNVQDQLGTGYHSPLTHDANAKPVSTAPLPARDRVAALPASAGGVNAFDEIGSGYHVPLTHDANAKPVSTAPAPASVRALPASAGGVNAVDEIGGGYHVPQTHAK